MDDGAAEPKQQTEPEPAPEPEPEPEPAWRSLHESSVVVGRRLGLLSMALIAFFLLLAAMIGMLAGRLPGWVNLLIGLAWAGVSGFLVWLAWAIPLLRFRHTRYRVDPLGLLLHRGRLFHSELAVARSRIQHTDVSQGPVQRAYELATLTIHTAGTENAQIELSGITLDEARRLRTELTGQSGDDVV